MKLSFVCVTKFSGAVHPFITRFIAQAYELGAEVVFGAHGETAQTGLRGVAHAVVPVEGKFLEEMIDPVLDAATGDYVLRVDDDERLPQEFLDWLSSGAYLEHDSWFFPRFHLWPDTDHVITSQPCFPDFNQRLTTREKAYRPNRIHAGSPYPAYRAPVYFEHHNLLVKTKEERRALTAHYATIMGQPHTPSQVNMVFPEDVQGVHIEKMSLALMKRANQIQWWRQAGMEIPAVLEREFREWGQRRGLRAIRPKGL